MPDVLDEFPIGLDDGLPVTSLEQADVAADDGVAFLLEQVDQMAPDVPSMASDKNFHEISLRGIVVGRVRGGRIRGSDGPGGLAGRPELVQVLEVALGVHAGPEAAVLVHAELAVAGETNQGLAFEDAALILGRDRGGNRAWKKK